MGIRYLDEAPASFSSSSIKYLEPEEDQYRKAAREERDRIIAKGGAGLLDEGYTRRLTQGLGMNWTDEAVAGLTTPLEMIKRGTLDPREGYRYAKARENLALEKARENTGLLGSGVEVLGGLASGGRAVLGKLPQAGAAIQQAPGAWNAVGRYFGNTGKAALVGGAGGAGEGDTLGERGAGAAVGTVLGGVIGAIAPGVIKGASWFAQPATNQFRRLAGSNPTSAFSNVDDIATQAVADTIARSGKAGRGGPGLAGHWEPARIDPATGQPVPSRFVSAIEREVTDANAAGQPYIMADAIGLEGQRRLAAIAKQPGAARQWIDDDLVQRDLGRRMRASDAVSEGMGVPPGMTAEMASEWLRRQAQQRSRPLYKASDAVQPTWSPRMQEFFEYPEFRKALTEGFHLERGNALAAGRPFNPHDYAVTDFDAAGDPILGAVPNMRTIQLMKEGIDELINKHRNPLTGRVDPTNRQALNLQNLQRAFLREVDSLNPMYGRARAAYAGPAQIRTAIERGQKLPDAGQPADTIRRMQQLPETSLQGTRIGVADRIATASTKGTETGPLPAYLRNPKGRAELEYLSLHQGPRQPIPANPLARRSDPQRFQPDPMRRALEREETMRKTLFQTRGGSQTAENLADMADTLPPPPDLIGVGTNFMAGNWLGALKGLLPASKQFAKGETEAQRTAMARILMERDPQEMAAFMQRVADLNARKRAAATARAGATAGAGGGTGSRELTRVYVNRRD